MSERPKEREAIFYGKNGFRQFGHTGQHAVQLI